MDINMDNFMDEIVQKFTPQDMIRANAAAEAAEIDSLEKQLTLFKDQMAKYDDCLQEMRQLNLKNIESAQDVQQMADKAGEKLGQAAEEVQAASVSSINKTLDESLAKIAEIKETANNTEEINAIIKNLEEFLHTDNVKVYRNVQASMVEELDKRTEDIKASYKKTSRKIGAIFTFSLITMILSIFTAAALGLMILSLI